MIRIFFSLIICFLFLLGSCEKINLPDNTPACLKRRIRKQNNNCLDKVYQYESNNQKYYLLSSDCPDDYSDLIDDNCKCLCQFGGISGGGNGECPKDFNKNKQLIWSKK